MSDALSAPVRQLGPLSRLRIRVWLFSMIVILLLVFLVSAITGQIVTRRTEAQAADILNITARHMAYLLDVNMHERIRDVEKLSNLEMLRDPDEPIGVKRRRLNNLLSSHIDYAWIGLTDTDGTVIAASRGMLEGQNVSERPWFAGARHNTFVGDVHTALLLEPLLSPNASAPMRFVDVAVPVYDLEGNYAGVLGAHLDWIWALNIQRAMMRNNEGAANTELLILDQALNVILGPAGEISGTRVDLQALESALANQQTHFIEQHSISRLTGVAVTQGYQAFPGLGWIVLARSPLDTAYVAARDVQQQLVLLGLIAALGFGAVSWLLAERVSRPILEIAGVADRIRMGDRDTSIPVFEGTSEVAVLSKSLNALVTDLTTQMAARVQATHARQQSEDRLAILMREAHELILIIDAEAGTILDVNPVIEHALGYKPEELIGQPMTVLFPPHPVTQNGNGYRPASLYSTQEVLRKDGSVRLMESSASMIPWDDRMGVMTMMRDVTERENAREALRRAELLDLELQKEREIAQVKDGFVSMVSHEFRNPLAVITSSMSLLQRYYDRMDAEKRATHFERIAEQAQHMAAMLDDLLLLLRARSGRLEVNLAPLDLVTFCKGLIEEFRDSHGASHPIELTVNGTIPKFTGDSRIMRHILNNLMSNALKYSPPGSRVNIDIDASGDGIEIRVRDRGIGIPEADRKRMFEPFHRARNVGETPGTGLGLSIVYQHVQLLGGRIDVDSVEGQGSTFTVVFPERLAV